MKLELFGQTFEKYTNIIFNENSFSGRQVSPLGRTDGHGEVIGYDSQFCKSA
jgi:hypothetical protein